MVEQCKDKLSFSDDYLKDSSRIAEQKWATSKGENSGGKGIVDTLQSFGWQALGAIPWWNGTRKLMMEERTNEQIHRSIVNRKLSPAGPTDEKLWPLDQLQSRQSAGQDEHQWTLKNGRMLTETKVE